MASAATMHATFNSMAGPFFSVGPRNATDLFNFDVWLKKYAELPADERCMIVNWVATGRDDAWYWQPDGAVEICAAKGFDVSLKQSLTDLSVVAPPYVVDTVLAWGKRKATQFKAVETANVKQDVSKGVTTVTTAAAEVAAATKKGIEDTGRSLPFLVLALGALAVYLVVKKVPVG